MHRQIRQQRIACLEQTCHEHGLPVTVQRRAVFEAVLDHRDHPTADQVYGQVKTQVRGISRASVYRILDALVELGLITRICHHISAARFDGKVHRHHHLVCSHCESIIDLDAEAIPRIAPPDVAGVGFQIDDYCVHFRGTCARCCARSRKKGRPSRGREPLVKPRRSVEGTLDSCQKRSKKP
ncbi:MAG: transcriptional repressor [Planctomycetes bacterium]|nr:transcriptional repressor [Planctomycetota bacterium]